MEEPCLTWFTEMEIQDDVLFNQRYKIESLVDGDQMFREMMQHQPAFSSDSESHSPTIQNNINNNIVGSSSSNNNNLNLFNNNIMNNSSNFIFSSTQHAPEKPVTVTSPTSFILSFGDSTVVAATPQTYGEKQPFHPPPPPPPPPSKGVSNQNITKKARSSTETLDHIMAERKRRRELTERFIALSATIPGLKKIDKSTILGEAITHVKRLQERVRELEEQSKKTCVQSVSFIRKTTHEKGTTFSAILNTDDCYRTKEALPTVEARVFKKDVLLRIHSKIESGILLKILDHLKNLDLSTISSSVTPFGNSTLDISIIAQMGDKFNITINDLVKNLRLALLESEEVKVQ